MMTIQTQNPASIEPFHKLKILVLIILFIVCVIATVLYFAFSTNKYSAKIYDNSEFVEEVFATNQGSFADVAYILNNSELFDYLYSIDKKSIFSPSIPKRKEFLTDTEYELLCDFLHEYQPYEIGKRNGDLYFVFLCKNEDVTLYYTERIDDSLYDFLNVINQHSHVIPVDNNWYFRVQSRDVIRQATQGTVLRQHRGRFSVLITTQGTHK